MWYIFGDFVPTLSLAAMSRCKVARKCHHVRHHRRARLVQKGRETWVSCTCNFGLSKRCPWKMITISWAATIPCPESHPYSCGGGALCSPSLLKPQDSSHPDCDGGIGNMYSSCCHDSSIPCNKDSRERCHSNPTKGMSLGSVGNLA